MVLTCLLLERFCLLCSCSFIAGKQLESCFIWFIYSVIIRGLIPASVFKSFEVCHMARLLTFIKNHE